MCKNQKSITKNESDEYPECANYGGWNQIKLNGALRLYKSENEMLKMRVVIKTFAPLFIIIADGL